MTIQEAMQARHSVRQYFTKPIANEAVTALNREIRKINETTSMHIQLILNEPKAFSSRIAHYGSFVGVENYIALVGKDDADLEEKCGYYGEQLVLLAQTLGLNTCWVGLTYKKVPNIIMTNPGEKLILVIAVGYGAVQGKPHKSKEITAVSDWSSESPDWYQHGLAAVLLAPTAVNQQKFYFSRNGNYVHARAGIGFFTKTDLGIAKYHFEAGAGQDNFSWR